MLSPPDRGNHGRTGTIVRAEPFKSFLGSFGTNPAAGCRARPCRTDRGRRARHSLTDFYKSEAKRHSSAQQLNAHSLAHHLRRRTIRIYDHELIVGTHTEHRIGAICHIEKAGVAMLEDLFRFEKRAVNPLAIDPKARWTLLRSVIPYWLNRNITMQSFPLLRRNWSMRPRIDS